MIERATEKHILKILHISNSCFGNGYITIDQIRCFIEEKSAWVYLSNDIVSAFVFIIYYNDTDLIIKTLAIDKLSQNKGIGKALLEYICFSMLICKDIYYYAWKENIPQYFINTLLYLGFIETKTIKNYWKEDSIVKKYECIKCGNPCNCTLQIFELKRNKIVL